MSWQPSGEREYNGGEVVGRTEWFGSDPSVDEVIETLRELSKGLRDPTVEFLRDPCPYGGFDSHGVEVMGRRA